MKRIDFLDGFRGLAILLVVLYHAYFRWAAVIPLETEFSNFPIISNGWIGVQLFFLISGFVILMTLEKCTSLLQFLTKRWLRLFPAMFISTILIYLTIPLLPERPESVSNLSAAIPGLLFIEPGWIYFLTKVHTGILEGVFWSLFVEVKYYFIFGSLYFFLGVKRAVEWLFIFFLIWIIITLAISFEVKAIPVMLLNKIARELSFKHFGWFTTGSLCYLYYSGKERKYIFGAVITGLLSALSIGLPTAHGIVPALAVLLIFIITVYINSIKKIFSNKLLVFFGFISYPLYLIHQKAMVAMMIKLHKHFPGIPGILLPIIPILVLVTISYLVAKFGEPSIRKILTIYIIDPMRKYWEKKHKKAL